MKSDININQDDVIKALLVDPNLPKEASEKALDLIKKEWRQTSGNILQTSWHALLGTHEDLLLQGGPANLKSDQVEVARVMALSTFVEFFLRRRFVMTMDNHRDEELAIELIKDGNLDSSIWFEKNWARDCVWVTLHDELRDVAPEDVCNALALNYFRDSVPLIFIAYKIESRYLHIPTVLDAHLDPNFVSKPHTHKQIPRAWNWDKGCWGLAELVHHSRAPIHDIRVSWLGDSSESAIPHNLFSLFSLQYKEEMEQVVKQILRQISGYEKIEQFLDGQTDLLSINPYEFERFLGALCELKGYETLVTKASGDGGYDVIAFEDEAKNGLLIQAKHTKGSVGIRVIRELIGARFLASEEYANYMLVVATTGKFSKVAKDAEKQFQTQIKLIDYIDLQSEISSYRQVGLINLMVEAAKLRRQLQNFGRAL
jgi:HJR/Mrr/RecB family endonuclease